MEVVYFNPEKSLTARRWEQAICSAVPIAHDVSVGRSTDDLLNILKYARSRQPTIVMYLESEEAVDNLQERGAFLDALFLIIICGHQGEEIFSKCRTLYPRLLLHANEDPGIVISIVRKRLETVTS